LKQIHSATHPGASLEKKKPARVSQDAFYNAEPLRANLFATLDEAGEDD
jgi:hypothetical protein